MLELLSDHNVNNHMKIMRADQIQALDYHRTVRKTIIYIHLLFNKEPDKQHRGEKRKHRISKRGTRSEKTTLG